MTCRHGPVFPCRRRQRTQAPPATARRRRTAPRCPRTTCAGRDPWPSEQQSSRTQPKRSRNCWSRLLQTQMSLSASWLHRWTETSIPTAAPQAASRVARAAGVVNVGRGNFRSGSSRCPDVLAPKGRLSGTRTGRRIRLHQQTPLRSRERLRVPERRSRSQLLADLVCQAGIESRDGSSKSNTRSVAWHGIAPNYYNGRERSIFLITILRPALVKSVTYVSGINCNRSSEWPLNNMAGPTGLNGRFAASSPLRGSACRAQSE